MRHNPGARSSGGGRQWLVSLAVALSVVNLVWGVLTGGFFLWVGIAAFVGTMVCAALYYAGKK
jgi:uncharacterized ion transporter superfamily protein YfcC